MTLLQGKTLRAGTLKAADLSPSERESLVRTLDSWLRPDATVSIGQELPCVFGEGRAEHVFLEDRGGLLAHAAIQPVRVDVEDQVYEVNLVSSVAVRPDQRGKGFGKKLFEACDAFASPPFLLWSDKTGFYERVGFTPFGKEYLVALSSRWEEREGGAVPSGPGFGRIREAEERDIPALELLHAGNKSFCSRSRKQWRACLRIPGARTFLLMNKDLVRPIAYAAMGKGLDFPNTVHDLGGNPKDLAELLTNLPALLGKDIGCLLPNRELFPLLPLSRVEERPFALAKGGERLPDRLFFGGFSSV